MDGEPGMTHVLPSLIAGLLFLTLLLPNPVVAATSAPVPNAPAATVTHVVAPGDTLYSIARRYGTTVDALKATNGLTSDVIRIGQTLYVGSSSPQPSTGTYHTVVRGDTLYSLARRYSTTVDAIMRANRLTSPNIYVGQRLLISSSPVPPVGSTTYTVVKGDTLYSIARRYGTTVDAIKAANKLSSNYIYVGQLLRIPQQSATFRTATPLPTHITTPAPTATPTPTGTVLPTPTPSTTAVATSTPVPTSTPTGQPPVQGGIGQDVFVGDVRWRVLSAENLGSTLTSATPLINDITTPGKFIRVRLEVENLSSGLLSYGGVNLIDSQGRSFIASSRVYLFVPDNEECVIIVNLNPNVPRICTEIFEVAANSTGLHAKVGDLEIIDDEEALIDLGF